MNTCITPTFFCLFQTFCNLVPGVSSLFDVNFKKYKDPGDEFGRYTFVQDLRDTRVEGLFSNMDYLENQCRNFIQKEYGRKRRLSRTHFPFSLDCNFSFDTEFLHCWWLLKVKKINKALSMQSKQLLLLFYFLVWKIEFQNSISDWILTSLVNGGPLVLE